ncbi:hypothetical protein AB0F91_35820 [Amycolatopsis sp. NPDC023774]|uniref:hypothetical protein n=1 Tax=Amycolatopsis sp. NPDC023774 TaxID=3155015 RepID=UPI0033D63A4B
MKPPFVPLSVQVGRGAARTCSLGLSFDALWLALTITATFAAILVFFEVRCNHLQLQLFTAALMTVTLACTFRYAPGAFSDADLVDPIDNLIYMVAMRAVRTIAGKMAGAIMPPSSANTGKPRAQRRPRRSNQPRHRRSRSTMP